ncbi:MAG TPA: prepilin-type N-terminal cleavage/methylation domain-containing protein [Solirubrobacteraceae bacterium]|nr:prepilin-type N-terminal cleavage/methylation domain-containing protein [Solirubrobacteraceae bacterium]
MRGEDGFSLIELLVAVTVLLLGTVAAITAFDSARRLSTVAERQTLIAHRAQLELERVASLPYSQLGLTASPATSTLATDPGYYVTVPASACPGTPLGGGPTYQPDHAPGGSSATEPVVVNGCTYGAGVYVGGTVAPSHPWSDGTASGVVYDYITYVSDPNCAAGTICPASRDYKRVTVVATMSGVAQPTAPALIATYVADASAIPAGAPSNSQQNPLQSPNTQCSNGGGAQVLCNNALTGTPVTYFLSDTPSGGIYSPPACGGNNLHATLLGALSSLLTGSPDQLISSPPTGACTTPPCFAVNLGCGTTPGVPLVPATSGGGGSCGTPPADNTKSHTWVTPAIPAGTTVNLNGTGGMTTFVESTSAVAVDATICLGLYIVPSGLLGGVLGNLLSQPIGVAVQASVTATAGVPTPVSFNFNVGRTASISSTVLNLARIELVVWVAASAATNVAVGYDQAQLASQVTLMTT